MTYARRRRAAVKRVRAGSVLTQADHDRLLVDWRANAREALEFAADVRKDMIELNGFVPERERQAIGRLVRWADERAR